MYRLNKQQFNGSRAFSNTTGLLLIVLLTPVASTTPEPGPSDNGESPVVVTHAAPESGRTDENEFPTAVTGEGSVRGNIEVEPRGTGRAAGFYGRRDRGRSRSTPAQPSVAIWVVGTDDDESTQTGDRPVLNQVDLAFDPGIVIVRQGGEVRILNSDPVYHNVFSLSRTKRFDVGRRPQGDHLDVAFDEAGVVEVFCDIHPDMHAVILVVPSGTRTWMKLDEPDEFSLKLPEGSYELNIFASGYDINRREIMITAGGELDIGTIRLEP